MDVEDIHRPRTLAWFLRRFADDASQDPEAYIERIDWFPQWCAENPADAELFKELMAAAIVGHTVAADELSQVAGHIAEGATLADVDGVMRNLWYDLWGNEPIPDDRHPRPPWWGTWFSTPYMSTAGFWYKTEGELEEGEREYLERRGLTLDAIGQGRRLFRAIVPPGDRLPIFIGYRRMMYARWDGGDRTAEPSLPPNPDDLDQALDWLDWYPAD